MHVFFSRHFIHVNLDREIALRWRAPSFQILDLSGSLGRRCPIPLGLSGNRFVVARSEVRGTETQLLEDVPMLMINSVPRGSNPRRLLRFYAKAVTKGPNPQRILWSQGRSQTPTSWTIRPRLSPDAKFARDFKCFFGQVAVQSPETWTNHKSYPGVCWVSVATGQTSVNKVPFKLSSKNGPNRVISEDQRRFQREALSGSLHGSTASRATEEQNGWYNTHVIRSKPTRSKLRRTQQPPSKSTALCSLGYTDTQHGNTRDFTDDKTQQPQHTRRFDRCLTRTQSSSLDVKSIPTTTENWLRKRYNYSMNNDTSTEGKHETNHINNKCNDMNTRNMHIT